MRYTCKVYSLLLGFLLLNASQPALATHIFGGEIIVEAVSCASNTYNIKVVAYEDSGSEVEFGGGVLDLGYGEAVELNTENDFERKLIGPDKLFRVSTYTIRRTFPGPGTYLINFREFNRTASIANMRNAVNTPFYVETKFTIDPLMGCNSSPVLLDSLDPRAYTGSTYLQKLNATDPDGDSLSFTFTTPKQDIDVNVDRYLTPVAFDVRYAPNPTTADGTAPPTLTADKNNLNWDAPQLGGDFSLALQVTEWRKVNGTWLSIGYVTRDMTLWVQDTVNHTNATDFITDTKESVENQPETGLYPNPSTGPVTLKIGEDTWQGGVVSVYNVIGQRIEEKSIDGETIPFNLSAHTDGVYFFTLRNGAAQKTFRLLKK